MIARATTAEEAIVNHPSRGALVLSRSWANGSGRLPVSLRTYLEAAPKAELHIHLEGAVPTRTLRELAGRHDVELPAAARFEPGPPIRYRDFAEFKEAFQLLYRCLLTAEDYELLAYDLGRELAQQGVRYAEVRVTPAAHAPRLPFDVWFGGLTRGRRRAEVAFGVRIRWVFEIARDARDPWRTERLAEDCTSFAIEGHADGVVALGLSGDENAAPAERFAPMFDRARGAGLYSAPHAGEHAGPESVWAAIRVLGADRIAHGVRAIEDASLVAYLAREQIALEIAPTSNCSLGVCEDLAQHPLVALHDAGVPVTVNTDDPALFRTTLSDEVAALAHPMGLDIDAIDEILVNGVRHSFLPGDETAQLEAEFRRALGALRTAYVA